MRAEPFAVRRMAAAVCATMRATSVRQLVGQTMLCCGCHAAVANGVVLALVVICAFAHCICGGVLSSTMKRK